MLRPYGFKKLKCYKECIFRKNPFDKRLKTHKLSGKEKEAWAFRVDYSYRIKFIFLTKNEVLFLDIGTHDFYKGSSGK